MSRIQKVSLLVLAVLMLGGRTVYLSNVHENHYFSSMYDPVVDVADESFTPCSASLAGDQATGGAWCIVPSGRVEILRQFTIAIIANMDDATEDCTFIIETSPDRSSWTTVASSEIKTGDADPGQINAAGVCAATTYTVDVVGDFCTRTLADGVSVPAGGGWRIALNTSGGNTCTNVEGVAAHVVSIYQ